MKKGLGFGLTSGVITTLGLMIGTNAATASRLAVIGSIASIAIADAISDGFGMHIVEEVNIRNSKKNIWMTGWYTFLAKLLVALTFVIPVVFFPLDTAMIISIIWGALLITGLSYQMAFARKEEKIKMITKHLLLTAIVIVLVQIIGKSIHFFFTT